MGWGMAGRRKINFPLGLFLAGVGNQRGLKDERYFISVNIGRRKALSTASKIAVTGTIASLLGGLAGYLLNTSLKKEVTLTETSYRTTVQTKVSTETVTNYTTYTKAVTETVTHYRTTTQTKTVTETITGKDLLGRPNVARFYIKWDAWRGKFFDTRVSWNEDEKNAIAEYAEIVFAIKRDQVPDIRQKAQAALNNKKRSIEIKLIAYINMWIDHVNEVNYTEPMYLHDDWPGINGSRTRLKIGSGDTACSDWLVDISNQDLLNALGNVIRNWLDRSNPNYLNGVFFDISAWDTISPVRGATRHRTSYPDPPNCTEVKTPQITNFINKAADLSVAFHKRMQQAIDPAGVDDNIHICNGVPRNQEDWDKTMGDIYLEKYFNKAKVDGFQFDTALVHNGDVRDSGAVWKFTVDLIKRFISYNPPKYFLAKVEPVIVDRTSIRIVEEALEYAFASYLLVTDGRYALFGVVGLNPLEWRTNPILNAELGNFDYRNFYYNVAQRPDGRNYSETDFVFKRSFENGVVLVNAHNQNSYEVLLPQGTYKDVLRQTVHSNTIMVPPVSGRLLVKQP
jgi:hypothetical protein